MCDNNFMFSRSKKDLRNDSEQTKEEIKQKIILGKTFAPRKGKRTF